MATHDDDVLDDSSAGHRYQPAVPPDSSFEPSRERAEALSQLLSNDGAGLIQRFGASLAKNGKKITVAAVIVLLLAAGWNWRDRISLPRPPWISDQAAATPPAEEKETEAARTEPESAPAQREQPVPNPQPAPTETATAVPPTTEPPAAPIVSPPPSEDEVRLARENARLMQLLEEERKLNEQLRAEREAAAAAAATRRTTTPDVVRAASIRRPTITREQYNRLPYEQRLLEDCPERGPCRPLFARNQ